MSDNYSLIIKNGSCYFNGKLIKTDVGLYENKIKKIGNIEENNSKVDRKSTRLNSSHSQQSRMPSSA